MQYQIWSEVYVNGMHTDLDNPPSSSLFKRAGSDTPSTKLKQSDSTSPEMVQCACQVSPVIIAAFTQKSITSGSSPARVIENVQSATGTLKISSLKVCLVKRIMSMKNMLYWSY